MSTRSAPLPRKRINNKNSLDDITSSPPPKRSVSASLGKREPPPVPIKTYLWEELRRARLLGGYPWTHLYKEPLDLDIDIVMDRSDVRRRRRRPESKNEQSAEASPPEDDSSETDGSIARRRRRKPEIDKDQSAEISPSESDATEDPTRRRRRRPESDSELTAEVIPSESTETDSSARRRRRRPAASQEPATTEKDDSDNITIQKLSEGCSEKVESEQTKDSLTESPLLKETGELVHSEEKIHKSSVPETEPISREEIYEIKERIQEDETKIIIILDDKNNPLKDETALPIPLKEPIESIKSSESRVLKDDGVNIPLSGVPTLEYDNVANEIDKGLTVERTDVIQEDPLKPLKTYSKILDDGSVYIPLSGEPVPDAETRLRTNIISEIDKRLTPDRKNPEEPSKDIKTYSRLLDDGTVYIPLTGEPVPDAETRLRTSIISETDKRLTPDRKDAEESSKDIKTYSRLLDDGTIYIPLTGEPVPDAETRLRTSIISETDKRLTPDRKDAEEPSKNIKTYSRLLDDGTIYIPLTGEPVSDEQLLKTKIYTDNAQEDLQRIVDLKDSKDSDDKKQKYFSKNLDDGSIYIPLKGDPSENRSEMTEADIEKEIPSEKNIDESEKNVILEPMYISGKDNKTDKEINISKSTISEPSSSELQKLVSELTEKTEIPTEQVNTSEKLIESELTLDKNKKAENLILRSESPAEEIDQLTGVAQENEAKKNLEYFSKTLPDGTVYIPLKGVPESSLLEKIEQSAKESICDQPSKTTNVKDLPDYTEIAENIRKEIEKEREKADTKIKYYSKVLDDGSIYIPLKGEPGNENESTLIEKDVDTVEKEIQDISETTLEKNENETTALEEAAPPAAIIETVYVSDTASSSDILSTKVIEPPEVAVGSLQQLVSDIIARGEDVKTAKEPEAVPITEIKDESPTESIEYFSKTLPDGTVYIPLKGVPDEDTLTAVERSAKEKLLSPTTDTKIKKVPDFTEVTEEIRKELEQERQKTPQPEIQTYSKVLSDGSVYIPLKGVPADDIIDNLATTEEQLNGMPLSEETIETKSTDASKGLTVQPQTDLLRRSKSKTPDFTELTEKIRKSIQKDRADKEVSKKGRKDQKFYSKVLDDGSIYIPLKGVPADTIEKGQLKTDDSTEKSKSDEKLNEIEQTEKNTEKIIESVKVEETLQEPHKEEKKPEEDSIEKTKSNEQLNKIEQTEKIVETTDELIKAEEKLKEPPKEEEKPGKDSIKKTKSNEKLNKKEQTKKMVESITEPDSVEEKLQKSTIKEKKTEKDKNFDITKLTDTIKKSLQRRKVDNDERKQKYFSKVLDDESVNISSTDKPVDDAPSAQSISKNEEPELVSSLPAAVKDERPKTPVIDITALTESIRESLRKEMEEKKKKDLKFYSQVLDDGSIYIPLKGEPSDEIKLKTEKTEQFEAENDTIQKQEESVEKKPVSAEKPEKVVEKQEKQDTSTTQITETNIEDSVKNPQEEQNEALAKVSTNTTTKKPSFKINLKALTDQIRRAEEAEKKAQLNYFSKVLDDGSIYIPLSGTPNPDVLERKHVSYVETVDENVEEKTNNTADVQPTETNKSIEESKTAVERPAVDLTKITDEIRDALLKEKAEKERKEKELTYFSKVLDDGTVYIPLKGVPIEEEKLQRSVQQEDTEIEAEKEKVETQEPIQNENEVNETQLSESKVVPENKENEMQIKAPKEEDTKEKDIKIITDSKEPETTGIKRVDSHIYEPIENPDENKENIISKKKKKPKSKPDKQDDETKKWTNTDDHEYEPINAPPEKVDARLGESRSDVSGSTTSLDRRFLRIPMDDEVVVTPDSQDISMASGDATGAGSSVQDDRYLNMSPTTTESRTSDIHTSQVDSSALENLPLKRDSRNRASLGNNRNNIQQKIRSQAGRLKTKLKGIKKPSFERPKFSMPKMPDRPKMSMPKMPKMPDRPKFTMPKMPERPKINFPSINLRRSKSDAATSSTQRPLRDRNVSSTESHAGSKKNLFDLNFRTYPRLLSRTKDKIKTDFFKEEKGTETQAAPPAAPKRPDTPPPAFWWQTIQRSSKRRGPPGTNWKRKSGIQGQDDDDSRMSKEFDSDVEAERDAKINAASQRDDENATGDVQQIFEAEKWDSSVRPVKIENLREAVMGAEETEVNLQDAGDQEMEIDNAQEDAQLSKHDVNKRSGSFLTNQEERSSGSSSERHRRGVLEEIDSDEFFLREKGISQDNIDVGLYLSNEIREAFRTPVNALSQMTEIQPPDYNQEMQPPEYYDEEYVEEDISERAEPERPKRKRKRSERKKFGTDKQGSFEHSITEDEQDSYNNYRTFPPARPRRKTSAKRQDSQEIKPEVTAERALGDSQQLEYIDYCSEIDDIRKDFELKKNIENLERDDETGQQIERTNDIPPMPPKRKQKSLRSLTLSEHDSFMRENFGNLRGSEELIIHRIEHEYIVPDDGSSSMPIAPKRTRSKSRSRSRGSRATSAADEDRTSHGAESLVSEAPTPYCEELPSDLQDDSIGDMFGYASVEKKEAQPKPPPPRKKKRKRGETQFFTVPRPLKDSSPPPVRPVRNYSTLGPSRPTRKKSVSSIKMNSEEKENIPSDSTQYVEIEDDEAPKRLQSGEVIEKMKSRPLPAPPRPPRIRRDKDSDDSVLKEILPDNKQQHDDETDEDKKPVDETILAPTETIPIMREPEKMSSEQRSEKVRSLDLSEDICQSGVDTDFYPESTITTTLESRTELYKESDDTDISPESKTLTQDSPTDVSKLADEEQIIEVEMSTQTDPLPDDFCCEEVTAGPEDIIIAPTRRRRSSHRLAAAAIASAAQRASEQAGPQTTSTQSLSTISIKDRRTPTHIGDTDQTLVEATMVVEPFSEFERSVSLAQDISEQTISEGSFTHPSHVFPLGIPPLPDQQATLPQHERVPSQQEQLTTQSPVTLQQQPTMSQQLPSLAADRDTTNISPQPHIVTHIIERQIPITVTPGPETEVEIVKAQRLQVADLDVERLTVSELLAQKILVSEIDGVGMKVQDLHSSGGNLVVNGIELPPEFIQGLAEQMQSFIQANQPPPPSISPQPPKPISESVGSQVSFEVHEMSTNTEQEKVAITEEKPLQSTAPPVSNVEESQPLPPKPEPPSPVTTSMPQQQQSVSVQPEVSPQIPIQLSNVLPGSPQMIQGIPYPVYYPDFRSVPPPSFYNLQSPRDESDENLQPAPVRRRRHFSHRASHSSSEEELRRSLPRSRRIVRTPDPGIPELSTQLVRACSTSAQRSLRQLISHIASHLRDEEGKQDVRSALIIVIVLIAGLIILGFGNSSKTVHHHHWDFLNPPDQHE